MSSLKKVESVLGHYGEDSLKFDNAEKKCPEGYSIVLSDDHTLQIDYDSTTLPENFDNMLATFRNRVPNFRWWRNESKSGNTHVTIQWPSGLAMSVHERIAWQAAFGSDPKREMLGLLRVSRGLGNPVLLFEKNDSNPIIHEVTDDSRLFRSE